jgi:acetyl-CoA C-acetyltransferase
MIPLNDIVAISAVRTPMGRFGGTMRDIPVWDLGAVVIREAVNRSGIQAHEISEIIFGNCRQAGNGPNPSRTAAVKGGIPITVPTQTINMACPSGMKTIFLGAQSLRLGEADFILAGGMDSMSTIPYLLKNARWKGFRMGHQIIEDGWSDSIDPLIGYGMGETAENLVDKYQLNRLELDKYALRSHQLAEAAWQKGYFKEEVVPVEIPGTSKKPPTNFSRDESIRAGTNLEKLSKLPAAFRIDGKVTAGNSCGLTDGACALVITTRDKARGIGKNPLFSIMATAQTAVEPETMGEGPTRVIPKVLKKAKLTLKDIDFLEVNEAFAAQILANERVLNWDRDKLNVHGGAIALGHPTGISGARIVITLQNVLRIHGGEIGLAAICGGGGVTTAIIIRRES